MKLGGMSEKKPPLSTHIFMFPFKWDFISAQKNIFSLDYKTRTNTFEFKRLLRDEWEEKSFVINECNFGQFVYFYDFVRDVIFDHNYNNHLKYISDIEKYNQFLKYYEFKNANSGEYLIKAKRNDGFDIYKLKIEKINLFVYSSGVSILCFFLENEDRDALPEDILRINEYGRRIYPQFLKGKPLSNGAKEVFLSSEIRLDSLGISEKFEYFDNVDNINKNPLKISNHILSLLGEKFCTLHNGLSKTNNVFIAPILDDRMFVISWYNNDRFFEELAKGNKKDDFWYSYLFVDKKAPSCKNENMLRDQLQKCTYLRWFGDRQIFGITRYSFVSIVGKDREWLRDQMNGNYFYLALLTLLQRSCILKFSDEISEVALLEKSKEKEFSNRVHQLYKEFIRFTNKIYFKEITAQEQGIELYDMLQSSMNIESQISLLKDDINELHQFSAFLENEKQTENANNLSENANKLAKVGAIFLPATLFVGLLGMNTMPSKGIPEYLISCSPYMPFWISFTFTILIMIASFFIYKFTFNNDKN